jgi:hypothetical protein
METNMAGKFTKDGIMEEAGNIVPGIMTIPPHLRLNRKATAKLFSAVAAEYCFHFNPYDVKFENGQGAFVQISQSVPECLFPETITAPKDVEPLSRWDFREILVYEETKASSVEFDDISCSVDTVASVVRFWLDRKFPEKNLSVIHNQKCPNVK